MEGSGDTRNIADDDKAESNKDLSHKYVKINKDPTSFDICSITKRHITLLTPFLDSALYVQTT